MASTNGFLSGPGATKSWTPNTRKKQVAKNGRGSRDIRSWQRLSLRGSLKALLIPGPEPVLGLVQGTKPGGQGVLLPFFLFA